MLATVVRASLWQVVPVLGAGLALGQLLRVVGLGPEPRDQVRPGLGRLGSLLASVLGATASLYVGVLALLLIPFLLFAFAFGAAFGGDQHLSLLPFAVLLAVAVVALRGFGRIVRRLLDRVRTALRPPANPSGSTGPRLAGRTFVAAIGLITAGTYVATAGVVPAWEARTPACSGSFGFTPRDELHPPARRTAPPLPSDDIVEAAAALGVPVPPRPAGMPAEGAEVVATSRGGISLRYRARANLPYEEVSALVRAAAGSVGPPSTTLHPAPRSVSVLRHVIPWLADTFDDVAVVQATWQRGATSGMVTMEPCNTGRASEVTSAVELGPEHFGDCAPEHRRAVCAAIYEAVDALFGTPQPSLLVPGDEPTPTLASVVATPAGELVVDQPAVSPASRPGEAHIDETDRAVENLLAAGWTDVGDEAYRWMGQLHLVRDLGGVVLDLQGTVHFAETSFRIGTLAPVPDLP